MLHILLDPSILIVIATFVGILTYVVKKYQKISKELVNLCNFLEKFKKSDLSFRFRELDNGMTSNKFVVNYWEEFKNTLLFSDSTSDSIQCTVEPACFFNEETMITSRLNYKIVNVAPTILTGLGPLFTFMHIGLAFAKIDFSSQENTVLSVGSLMSSMQAAAMVSVLAIGASLIFLFIEKNMYTMLCKKHLQRIEEMLNKLFDSISSEKFLIELLKENKKQNVATTGLLKDIPTKFSESLNTSLSTILLPYIDNMLYTLNKIQDKTSQAVEIAQAKQNSRNNDDIDDLF